MNELRMYDSCRTQPIIYGNTTVCTSYQLSEWMDVNTDTIMKLFIDNQKDFIEHEHYIFLNELNCYLWTRLAAIRFARMTNTDAAWNAIENIIPEYFSLVHTAERKASKQTYALDSREVAEMVEKPHNELLKDIRRYCKQLGQGKIPQSDFFTESTYKNSQNKVMPCYQVTKKGCEFVAHKLTGTKGTIFTARYINRFHEMEDIIAAGGNSSPEYTAYKEMPAAPQNIHVQAAVRAIQSLINEGFTIQRTIRGEDFREPFLGYSDDAGSIYIKPSLLYDRYCSLIPGTALNRGAFYQILDEAGLIRKNNKDWVHNRHGYSPYIHITCKNLKQYPFLRFRHEVLASFGLLPM